MQKIIATIGPITSSEEALKEMNKAGMNIARLNGSHSDFLWHKKVIKRIQKVLPFTPIIFDIPGRKVRTGDLGDGFKFKKNDLITYTTNPRNNNKQKIFISLGKLINKLKKNTKIYVDDGSLSFIIKKIDKYDIKCIALCDGIIKSKKGFNIPNLVFDEKFVTKKDKAFIEFAKKNNVDFIGLSFVESGKNIEDVKRILGNSNFPKIISKIENQTGLNKIHDILKKTDLIMIDRGDLAIETNPSEVIIYQKKIISISNKMNVPVIVATEMLNNMISFNYPTKAEISDITNACIDNCSATMLSGETAVSENYINNISTMKEIIKISNKFLKKDKPNKNNIQRIEVAIQRACLNLCDSVKIKKVIAITKTGYAAKVLSLCNIKQPIIAVCSDNKVSKYLNILNNVKTVYMNIKFEKKSSSHIKKCIIYLLKKNIVKKNDLILITYVGFPNNNFMNVLQTHYVRDLVT